MTRQDFDGEEAFDAVTEDAAVEADVSHCEQIAEEMIVT